jgi:hypothetical protein
LRQQWAHWIWQRRLFPDLPMWWGRYVKKKTRQFYIQEGFEHWREFMRMENFIMTAFMNFCRPLRERDTAQSSESEFN